MLVREYLIAIALIYPIAVNVGNVSGKPLDFTVSDLALIPIFLLTFFFRPKVDKQPPLRKAIMIQQMAVAMVVYCVVLAGMSAMFQSDMMRFVSAFKFVKPVVFVILGAAVARHISVQGLLKATSFSLAGLAYLLLVSTMFQPNFPFGHWGMHLFFSEAVLYGYPNMSQTFLAVTAPLMLALADSSKSMMAKSVVRFAVLVAAMLVVGSYSRSSTIALMVGLLVYAMLTGRKHLVLGGIVAIAMVGMTGLAVSKYLPDNAIVQSFQQKIELRASRTFDSGDAFSGRTEIWQDTLVLCAERPLFGYGFESFSHYSHYDTPHQQYLEILFKTGLVGLLLYAMVLVFTYAGFWQLYSVSLPRSPGRNYNAAMMSLFLAVAVGNLSQPNLSYSLTGNFMFFLSGFILRGAAEMTSVLPASDPLPSSGSPLASGRLLANTAPLTDHDRQSS